MRTPTRCRLLALAAFSLAYPIRAQTATTVTVPGSSTTQFFTNACRAETKRFRVFADTLWADTLRLNVTNDRGAIQNVTAPLRVISSIGEMTLPKDSGQLVLTAKPPSAFAGTSLTIVRASDGVLVCSLTVPTETVVANDELAERNPFRVGIGASFNFLDGVSKTDIYADVSVFLPTVWTMSKGRVGIDAGLYNARTVRNDTLLNQPTIFRLPGPDSASVTLITQTRSAAVNRRVDRLGFYAAPTLRLSNGLYLFVQGELAQNTIRSTFSTQAFGPVDTSVVMLSDSARLRRLVARRAFGGVVPTADTTKSPAQTILEPYFTFGAIVSIARSGVEFRLKPQLGYGAPFGFYGAYYAVQFRLTDFSNGFKLGGEVRGLTNRTQTSALVYLAKDFSLKKLAGFIVGGDEK